MFNHLKLNHLEVFPFMKVTHFRILPNWNLLGLVEIVKFGWNCEIWSNLWYLIEIMKFGWNCDIWLKLWNLVEIVKFGGNCEIWWKLWTSVNICEHLGTSGNIWEHLGTSRKLIGTHKATCGLDGLDHWNTYTLEHRCAVLTTILCSSFSFTVANTYI